MKTPFNLSRFVIRLLVLAAALVAVGLILNAFSFPPERWRQSFGPHDVPAPVLQKELSLGQSFTLPRSGLSFVEVSFGTFLKQASGEVELSLLSGGEAPKNERAINARLIRRQKIDASKIIDNAPWKFSFDPVRGYWHRSFYLLVRRIPSQPATPLTVWLTGQQPAAPRPADLLISEGDGRFKIESSPGPLSLVFGGAHGRTWWEALTARRGPWFLRALCAGWLVIIILQSLSFGSKASGPAGRDRALQKPIQGLFAKLKDPDARIRSEERIHLICLAAITLAGVAIRLRYLFSNMLADEAGTYMQFASKPLVFALSDYTVPNNHLFHTLLVHWSTGLFGPEPWAIRLPAFVAGCLLIPVSYLAIRYLFNKQAAILAAGLASASAYMIHFSTNARGYTIMILCFLACLSLTGRAMEKGERGLWTAGAVLAALGFYTIPTMTYPFALLVIWLIWQFFAKDLPERLDKFRSLVVFVGQTIGLTTILYLPIIGVSGLESLMSRRYTTPQAYSIVLDGNWHRLKELWFSATSGQPLVLSLLLAVGLIVGIILYRRLARHRGHLFWAGVIGCVALLLVQRIVPYARVWSFLVPLNLGLAGAGLVYLGRRIVFKRNNLETRAWAIAALILAVILSWGLSHTQPVHPFYPPYEERFDRAEEVAAYLAHYLRPEERSVLVKGPAGPILEFYWSYSGVNKRHFRNVTPATDRAILVVYDRFNLDWYLNGRGSKIWPIDEFGPPEPLTTIGPVKLYEMKRLR